MRNHFSRHGKRQKHGTLNQCKKKRLNKKRKQRKRSFLWKREDRTREFCCSLKDTYFLGTVFYTKKHKDDRKTKKRKFKI